jgi:tRNA U34 5-carboxymethylaminomethyl modifying GTPase MnmE/TrmE
LIKNDNILALASPSGIGAISMIRISGPESVSIVDKIFNGVEKLVLILHHNQVDFRLIQVAS